MRRVLNYKRLLCLMAAAALLGAGVHFLHAYQMKRNADTLLAQADWAVGRGQLDEATDYLSRYLGLVPGDVDVLVKYGETLDALAQRSNSPKTRLRALFAFERALRREPGRNATRRRLVRVAMAPGVDRFSDAAEHL